MASRAASEAVVMRTATRAVAARAMERVARAAARLVRGEDGG